MLFRSVILLCFFFNGIYSIKFPFVICTWEFKDAAQTGYNEIKNGGTRLDAVEKGCSKCEELQCDGSVGNNKIYIELRNKE